MTRLHPPVPEPSLAGIAYDTLREQICTCELAPGQLLTERRAAARLGIGLLPARDALTMLTRDGLVRRIPPRGYQVAPLTPKSVDDFFVAWRLIGPEIVRRGVREASDQQVGTMHRLVSDFEALSDMHPRVSTAQFVEIAQEMFTMLAAATSNDRLVDTYRCLAGEMSRIWSLLLADATGPDLVRAARLTWRPALENHDGDRAAESTRDFIESSHARARRLTRAADVISLSERRQAMSTG